MFRNNVLRIAFAVLVMAGLAFAQGAKPPAKTPPKPASSKPAATTQPAKVFPYAIHHKKLANGFDVIVIPTPEFKDMVTYATPVFAGSGKEVHKGKTGLAHLFEHIMFRHEYGGKPAGYDEAIRRMGAHNNAFTSDDITFYHPTTFVQNLKGPIHRSDGDVPGLIALESDRFKNLKLDRKTFEVEAGAVLGEYRRNFANPVLNMMEKTLPVAFPNHPYGHTTLGFYDDVVAMPQAWDAAWEFFHNYYTPNSTALVVVGDVDPNFIFAEAEKAYGDWKPQPVPEIPTPEPPKGPFKIHVPWEADVAPRVMVSYHTPAFKPKSKEAGVVLILGELLTSRSAPLFQKLQYQKQTVTNLGQWQDPQSLDPKLLALGATLKPAMFKEKGDAYVADVTQDIITGIEDLKNFSKNPDATKTLTVLKSKIRNDLLSQLDSTGNIAVIFASFYEYDRDVNAIDNLMAVIDSLQPSDVDAYAQKYFTAERRLVTTLWKGGKPDVTKEEK